MKRNAPSDSWIEFEVTRTQLAGDPVEDLANRLTDHRKHAAHLLGDDLADQEWKGRDLDSVEVQMVFSVGTRSPDSVTPAA